MIRGDCIRRWWLGSCEMGEEKMVLLDGEEKLTEFLHSNIVENRCVDNLVCLNGEIGGRRGMVGGCSGKGWQFLWVLGCLKYF